MLLAYALATKFVFRQKLRLTGARLQDVVFLSWDESSNVTPVSRRDDTAQAAGCTHFISLHLNAGGGSGTDTFYRDEADEAFARGVHAGIAEALGFKDRCVHPESEIHVGRLAVLDFQRSACLVELRFVD